MLDLIRQHFKASPNVQVFTYTYRPLVGLSSETDPQGHITYYEYDSLGRFKDARDEAGNILNKYDYKYKGQ